MFGWMIDLIETNHQQETKHNHDGTRNYPWGYGHFCWEKMIFLKVHHLWIMHLTTKLRWVSQLFTSYNELKSAPASFGKLILLARGLKWQSSGRVNQSTVNQNDHREDHPAWSVINALSLEGNDLLRGNAKSLEVGNTQFCIYIFSIFTDLLNNSLIFIF